MLQVLLVIAASILIAAVVITLIVKTHIKSSRKKPYEQAVANWHTRARELGFSSAGKSVVHLKVGYWGDALGYFNRMYVWMETGNLKFFIAEPYDKAFDYSDYEFPENIRMGSFAVDKFYRTRVANEMLTAVMTGGKMIYFHEKDFEVFRMLMPNKCGI